MTVMLRYKSNPFNPFTIIQFDIKESGYVRITLFNAKGEFLKTIYNEYKQPGTHAFEFQAQNLPTGVYFAAIRVNGFRDIRCMTLLK